MKIKMKLESKNKIEALIDAAWQILDDLRDGLNVSLAAKAELRVAFEPFNDTDCEPYMTFEEATRILKECRK